MEDAKQIAYSKVKEDIQSSWNSTYLTDFKDYKYSVTKMVFNGTQVWNVIIEGIKRFDGSEVEYTVRISCSNGQVIFIDKTY